MIDELTESFADEAFRLLEGLEVALEALQLPLPEDARPSLAESVRRRLHTLKGNAGILGHGELQAAAHRLEDLAGTLDAPTARRVREGLGVLRAEVGVVAREGLIPGAAERLAPLDALLDHEASEAGVMLDVLEQRDLRVPQPRLDDLVAGVGEAAAAQSRLLRELRALEAGRLFALTEVVERLGTTLAGVQRQVLHIRNLRVGSVFQRLALLARDDARAAGKQIHVEVRGAEVELDKAVLDALGGTLVHLVRNAVAHGVELPEQRVRSGKTPEGRVRLSAEAHGGQVTLRIEDDGQGLNRGALAEKARDLGLDATLAAEELIFAAGLSTAELSTRAGRGVGMDAVRRAVVALGAQLEVSSTPGQGTAFSLTVPVTLALQRVLLVTLGAETFALPSVAVLETVDLRGRTQRWLGDGPALEHRGQLVPLVDAARVLGVAPTTGRSAVILESQGRAALVVDALPGHEEFAFETLDPSFSASSPASGAALSWDGRVVLRLDPGRLVRAARTNTHTRGAA